MFYRSSINNLLVTTCLVRNRNITGVLWQPDPYFGDTLVVVLDEVFFQSLRRGERRVVATQYVAGHTRGMRPFVAIPKSFTLKPSGSEWARPVPASEGCGAEILLELFEMLNTDSRKAPQFEECLDCVLVIVQ